MDDPDFHLMACLARTGPMSALALEQALALKRSAVHNRLTRLRNDGLVVGEKAEEKVSHRPRYLFSLTAKGTAALRDLLEGRLAVNRELLACLNSLSATGDRAVAAQ